MLTEPGTGDAEPSKCGPFVEASGTFIDISEPCGTDKRVQGKGCLTETGKASYEERLGCISKVTQELGQRCPFEFSAIMAMSYNLPRC